MNYFVIWPNGQKFGPADQATLRQWLQERRIDAQTILEEERSGQRSTAGHVLGLGFGPPPPAQQGSSPMSSPGPSTAYPGDPADHDPFMGQPYMGYYRPSQQGYAVPDTTKRDGHSELVASWILGSLGLVTVCCSNVILPLIGLALGFSAKSKGQPSAVAAIVFNGLVLLIHVGMLFFGLFFNVLD